MIKTLKGIAIDVIFTALTVLLSIASIPYYIVNLGLEQYGLWITLSSIITFINIFDLSTDQHIIKTGADDRMYKKKYWDDYLRKIIFLKLFFIMVVATACYITYSYFVIDYFSENYDHEVLGRVMAFCAFTTILSIIINFISSLLYSRGLFIIVNSINGVINVTGIIVGLIFVSNQSDISGIAAGHLVGSLLGFLIYTLFYFSRTNENLSESILSDGIRITFREIILYIYRFHLLKVSFLFRTSGVVIILGYVASVEFVGIYNLLTKIPQVISSLVSKINTPYAPIFSQLNSISDFKKLRNSAFFLMSVQALLATFFLIGLVLFLIPFVNLWSDVLVSDLFLVCIIALFFSSQILFSPYFQLIYASGQYGSVIMIFGAELVVFSVVSLSLFPIIHESAVLIALFLGSFVSQTYISIQASNFLQITFCVCVRRLISNIRVYAIGPVCFLIFSLALNLNKFAGGDWIMFFLWVVFYSLVCFIPVAIKFFQRNPAAYFIKKFGFD